MFRQYYRRPYFLPPMAEADEGNWFIVSTGENKRLNVSHHLDNFFQSLMQAQFLKKPWIRSGMLKMSVSNLFMVANIYILE